MSGGGWRYNGSDWYFPLHPSRQEDHLRVWMTRGHFADAEKREASTRWEGALVIDGEYLEVCRTHPHVTAEGAKEELWAIAKLYLAVLAGSLSTG